MARNVTREVLISVKLPKLRIRITSKGRRPKIVTLEDPREHYCRTYNELGIGKAIPVRTR